MKKPFAVIGFSVLFASVLSVFFETRLTLLAAALTGGCFICLLIKGRKKALNKYAVWSVSICTVTLTFLLTAISAETRTRQIQQYDGETAIIDGQILGYAEKQYGKYYYQIKVNRITDSAGNENQASFKIRMSSQTPLVCELYDSISAELTFFRFKSDFGLSSESSYWADGIVMGAYSSYGGCRVTAAEKRPAAYYLKELCRRLTVGIQVLLPSDQAGIVNAVFLGKMDGITEEVADNFRSSGVTHLLVVSGMHMAVIAGFLQGILKLIRVPRKLRNPIAIGGLIFFMLLIGLEPSVLRSGITLIIVLLADMIGRETDSVNSLGAAAVIMCIANPFIGGDLGFLLSVFATLGILLLYPQMKDKLNKRIKGRSILSKFVRLILSAVLLSSSASIMILPLQIYIFNEITLAGLIVTVLLTIPTSVILYLGALLSVLYLAAVPIPLLAPLQLAAGFCVELMNRTAAFFARFSGFRITFSGGAGMLVLSAALFLLGLIFLTGKTGRKLVFYAAACVLVLTAGFAAEALRYRNVITVAVVDQGEDSSVMIFRGREGSVLSLGGFRTSAAKQLIAKHRIEDLNTLVLTTDDYEGSLAAVSMLKYGKPKYVFAAEDFYINKDLRPMLSDSEPAADELELLEDVTAEVYKDGSMKFSLPVGTSFFVGNAEEELDCDIQITTNPASHVNAELTVLQTDAELWDLQEELERSGRYILASDSRITYIDCLPSGEYSIRREN